MERLQHRVFRLVERLPQGLFVRLVDWLAPRLADRLWHGQYRGQRQKWVALRFDGDDSQINIDTDEPEFGAWKWVAPAQLIDMAVPFKRDVYREVMTSFESLITS